MPTKRLQQFTAWSYSRLTCYEECPLKAKLEHLDKIRAPKGKALLRGQAIHEDAERFVRAGGDLPPALERFRMEFTELHRNKRQCALELQLAVDRGWHPVEWYAPEAWLRVVIDLLRTQGDAGAAVDYKSGQQRLTSREQLELYAPVVAAHRPLLKTLKPQLWYIDDGVIDDADGLTFDLRSSRAMADIQKRWMKRAAPLLNDVTFRARPGAACVWCWYGQKAKEQRKGPGLCRY